MKRKWIIGLLTLVLALGVGAAQVQGQSYRPYTNTIDLTVKNIPTFEAGLGIVTSGATWYVNSAATGTAAGTSWTNACLTVDACINLATASNGDIIRVAENHAESYTAANGFDVDKAGLTIIMHGTGTSAPTFTFADTDADIAIGAANVTIIGGRYLAGISAVVRGISIEAAGDNFTLIDPVFPEPLTSSFEFLDAILMASGADGFRLIRPVAFSADATGATHFLTASAGVVNNLQIIDPYIYGEYSVAPIFSDQINLEVLIKGGVITNLTTGQFAIEFTGASTGSIEDVLLRTDTQAIAVDPGSMTLKNVMWDDEDTADTIAIPVILGTAGVDSIGSVNSTTTDSIHGKIGTDTEMADASLYDMLVAIDDYIDTEVAAILADTDTISGISLPVAPVANSLAAFIASGGTALGTELADSKSLVDAIG
ncbi:MAG: hypothetical protein Q8O94_00775, partial [bacterium]|nr:hypothetical protein [bacterium]